MVRFNDSLTYKKKWWLRTNEKIGALRVLKDISNTYALSCTAGAKSKTIDTEFLQAVTEYLNEKSDLIDAIFYLKKEINADKKMDSW